MRPASHTLLAGTVALASAIGSCSSGEPTRDSTEKPEEPISQDRARALAAARYNALFAGKFYETTGNAYHAFPPLEAASLSEVVASGDAWLVSCEPPAGLAVRARVSRDGRWVEINEVSFASQ